MQKQKESTPRETKEVEETSESHRDAHIETLLDETDLILEDLDAILAEEGERAFREKVKGWASNQPSLRRPSTREFTQSAYDLLRDCGLCP